MCVCVYFFIAKTPKTIFVPEKLTNISNFISRLWPVPSPPSVSDRRQSL